MLHIVQVVLPGGVEAPQVFVDQSRAQEAFVACAKHYWKQAYASYCAREGTDADSYAAAKAFVATFDLADRSRIHEWSIPIETTGAAGLAQLAPEAALLQERQEQLRHLAAEVEQAAGVVTAGVAGLLEAMAGLSPAAEPPARQLPATADRSQPGRLRSVAPPVAPPSPQSHSTGFDQEKRTAYVRSLMHQGGGSRGESRLFGRADWRQAVYDNRTTQEYWDWAVAEVEAHIDKAQQAGYTVIDDTQESGCYWFRTPDGVVVELPCEAEGEAWCRAGMHLEGR